MEALVAPMSEVDKPLPVYGVLSKWVNLLKGSQQRFFVLDGGMVQYYKVSGAHRDALVHHELSKPAPVRRLVLGKVTQALVDDAKKAREARDGSGHGPGAPSPRPAVRGVLHLSQVTGVFPSDWEEVKFSIVTHKETLDLRCDSQADRTQWLEALRAHLAFYSGAAPSGGPASLHRADSRVLTVTQATAATLSARLKDLGCGPEAVLVMNEHLEDLQAQFVQLLTSERSKRRLLRVRVRELEEDKARLEATLVQEASWGAPTSSGSSTTGQPAAVDLHGMVAPSPGRTDASSVSSSAIGGAGRRRRESTGEQSDLYVGDGDTSDEAEDGDDDDDDAERPSLDYGDGTLSDEETGGVYAPAQAADATEFFDCEQTVTANSALAAAARALAASTLGGAAAPSTADAPHFLPPWQPDSPEALVPVRRRSLPVPLEPEVRPSLWSVIKGAIGRDLTRITLPVTFNEPLSALQKFCEELQYAELLSAAAAAPTGSVDRLLLVAAFAVSGYASAAGRGLKPFNPLERETFEYVCPERGWRFISEKVRHHPLHVAAHAEGPGWCFWGETSIATRFTGRSIQLVPFGSLHCRFGDGDTYSWRKVPSTVTNIILGPLAVEYVGTCRVQCVTTGQAVRLRFKEPSLLGSASEARQVRGTLEEPSAAAEASRDEQAGTGGAVLHGAWDHSISVVDAPGAQPRTLWRNRGQQQGGARYNFSPFAVSLNELLPGQPLPPTDSRLRPDQRLLDNGRFSEGDGVKMRLEEAQRATRKKLAESGLVPCPRWFRPAPLADVIAHGGRAPPAPPPPPAVPAAQLGVAPGAPAGENGVVFAYAGGYWEQRRTGGWSDVAPIFSAATTAAPV